MDDAEGGARPPQGAIAFRMPSLGADMEAGTVLEWHIAPGDRVEIGQLVALVDTEKAEIDVESFDAGVVQSLVVPVGLSVPVGTVLAWFGETAVPPAALSVAPTISTPAPAPPPAAPTPAPAPAPPATATGAVAHHVEPRVVSPLVRHLAEARHLDVNTLHGSGPGERVWRADVEPGGRPRASPRARRLAAERGVDLARLHGSGPGGAIVGDDVPGAGAPHAALPTPTSTPTPTPTTETSPTEPAGAGDGAPGGSRAESLRRNRQAIAAMMTRSWREIPHYHLSTQVELSATLAWLGRANEARPISERVLPAAVLLRATALAAANHPQLNGWFVDGAFRAAPQVDLATVVALRGGGLLAPTIGDAARLSLPELMAALREAVTRARRGRLRSNDTTVASITVTNLGDLGVDEVHGVIHPPQVALVGFGAIHEAPWAERGMIAARPVVQVSLAGDHRVSDGLAGAAFLADLARFLADPEQL